MHSGTHELDKLFMDVSIYNTRIMDKMHVEPSIDLAIHAALGYRGVVHLTIPTDIQVMEHGHRSRRNLPHHTSDVRVRTARLPDKSDLHAAASQLNAGQRIAIVAGQGALGAADELERVADLLAAPIVKPLLGKGAVPYDSPYTTGSIGLLANRTLAAGDGRVRHAADGRHLLSVYRVPPAARPGKGGPDRR